ncbi:AbiH family protein [Phascolarctobacterium faecium]|uniref:AbiH family protein n=1 Tax=Phascolarctobacterium faecium TaxID=33025 RepID=UPI000F0C878C|nr:AbiH family protein [Phascolarctobacterium faecium]BBG63561.1 hypothetical protein PFJ30894_01194 [Phascolarctobacterium faecium]
MDILLIGNGFDLAHKLPTTYKDFLDFLEKIHPNNYATSPSTILDPFVKNPSNKDLLNNIKELCFHNNINNIWYDYFHNKTTSNQNWCDFEKEIEYLVKQLEIIKAKVDEHRALGLLNANFSDSINLNFLEMAIVNYCKKNSKLLYSLDVRINQHSINYKGKHYFIILTIGSPNPQFNFEATIAITTTCNTIFLSFEDIVTFILKQLEIFTKCFELYLSGIVNELPCPKISFINNLLDKKDIKLLTFNYTNTLRNYKQSDNIEVCFIHGEACKNENDNLVLGIDENSETIDPMFTPFRKYFQRASKECNKNFRKWINDIKSRFRADSVYYNPNLEHNLYVIGHSLTLSDRFILNELITLQNMTTTIYYHSDDNRINLMKNLAAILGYQKFSELIENDFIKFEEGSFNRTMQNINPY